MAETVYFDDVRRRVWRRFKAYAGCTLGAAGVLVVPFVCLVLVFFTSYSPPLLTALSTFTILYGVKTFLRSQLLFKPEFTEVAGSAQWAKLKDLKRAGLVGKHIDKRIHPYIGQFVGSWLRLLLLMPRARYNVHYPGAIHIITVGPSEVGKDTGLIAANVRDLVGMSKVVLDIKGEIAMRCAGPLRKQGQQVVIMNIMNLLVGKRPDLVSQGYNCLSGFTVADPHCYEICRDNSAAMIVRRNGEHGHWDARADALLTFCQLYMKWKEFEGRLHDAKGQPRTATLADVFRMLMAPYRYKGVQKTNPDGTPVTKPDGTVDDTQRDMRGIISLHDMIHDAMQFYDRDGKPLDKPGQPSRDTLRFAANSFYSENPTDEEISGSISTAAGQLAPLIGDAVRADMAKHPKIWITDPTTGKRVQVDFEFRHLRDEPITVIVIVPFEHIHNLAIWTRLIITRAIKGIIKGDELPDVPSLLIVNEAYSVGDLAVLRDALAAVRYAGLKIWTIWQDLDQVLRNFGSFGSFLTNAGVFNTYRTNERTTAEEVRWRLGIKTEVTEAYSSAPKSDTQQRNKTRQGTGGNLMNLEALTRLRNRESIAFVTACKPVRLRTPVNLKGLDPFLEKKKRAA